MAQRMVHLIQMESKRAEKKDHLPWKTTQGTLADGSLDFEGLNDGTVDGTPDSDMEGVKPLSELMKRFCIPPSST